MGLGQNLLLYSVNTFQSPDRYLCIGTDLAKDYSGADAELQTARRTGKAVDVFRSGLNFSL